MLTNLLLTAVLAAAPPPREAAESASRQTRVVVYDLTSTAMAPEQLALLSGSLLAEIRKLHGLTSIGMDEVRVMLSEAERKQIEHCSDDSCLAGVAGALGAEIVVMGSVGLVGNSTVLSLKRLNMLTAEVEQSFTRRMSGGGGEELLESLGPAVEALFPGVAVRPGLVRGVPAEQVARWNPPPIKPWMTLSTAGAGTLAGVLATAFFIRQSLAESQFRDTMAQSTHHSVSATTLVSLQNQAYSSHTAVVVLAPVSVTLLAASGAMYFLTDWQLLRRVKPSVQVGEGGGAVSLRLEL